jgi:acetyl esterase/lipase
MSLFRLALLGGAVLAVVVGCKPPRDPVTTPSAGPAVEPGSTALTGESQSLADARKGFTTKLTRQVQAKQPVKSPPADVFRQVDYEAPVGKCAAYLTPDPKDGKKHPAIIWIIGGDCNTILNVWGFASRDDDQSAQQYRNAGIVMMFPSLRGGNENPGFEENFYGEVDDVLAAAEFLAKQEYVDPKRIYLGGHSTGGTLVLLVAEVPNPFRAVFSFGPVHLISNYPAQYRLGVNVSDEKELKLRCPIFWLRSIQNPTFVFEGTELGHLAALRLMELVDPKSRSPKVKFFPVTGASHLSILAPVNEHIARKIVADTGEETNLSFTGDELNNLMKK